MSSHLDSLRQFTTIVADTGDFESIREYTPQDATTNPSLILKAAQMDEYAKLVDKVLTEAREDASSDDVLAESLDKLAVFFGLEILKINLMKNCYLTKNALNISNYIQAITL